MSEHKPIDEAVLVKIWLQTPIFGDGHLVDHMICAEHRYSEEERYVKITWDDDDDTTRIPWSNVARIDTLPPHDDDEPAPINGAEAP